jgi:hypothetical protein
VHTADELSAAKAEFVQSAFWVTLGKTKRAENRKKGI